MKLPCEVIVFQIIPTVRGELAKELVKVHGYTQAKVASVFGVTSAAISQYIKGLRGGNPYIERSTHCKEFYDQIADSAERIAKGGDITDELCWICKFVKRTGMIDEIYSMQGAQDTLVECVECPRDRMFH